jgi:hypothetical protein
MADHHPDFEKERRRWPEENLEEYREGGEAIERLRGVESISSHTTGTDGTDEYRTGGRPTLSRE